MAGKPQIGWQANKQAGKPTNRLGSQQIGWEANEWAGKPTNRLGSQECGWAFARLSSWEASAGLGSLPPARAQVLDAAMRSGRPSSASRGSQHNLD